MSAISTLKHFLQPLLVVCDLKISYEPKAKREPRPEPQLDSSSVRALVASSKKTERETLISWGYGFQDEEVKRARGDACAQGSI